MSCLVLILMCINSGFTLVPGMPRPMKLPDRSVPLGQPHEANYVKRWRLGEEILREFVTWAGWSLEGLADAHPKIINEILCEFVSYVFDTHGARDLAESALLSFKEKFSWNRGKLHPAWKRLREWKLREPIEMRQPITEESVCALMSISLSW